MLLNYKHGVVNHQKSANIQTFLQLNASSVSILTDNTDLVLCVSGKRTSFLVNITTNVINAWNIEDLTKDWWVGVEVNISTGMLSYITTDLSPTVSTVSPTGTDSPYWFNLNDFKQYKFNNASGKYEHVHVVFVAKYTNGTFSSVSGSANFNGGFGGHTIPVVDVGYLVFDDQMRPIKTVDGDVITTTSELATGYGNNTSISNSQVEVIAGQTIPKYSIVTVNSAGRGIIPTGSMIYGVYGIIENDVEAGKTCAIKMYGIFSNNNWNWQTPNSKLYVAVDGTLTDVYVTGQPHVATTITPNTIYFSGLVSTINSTTINSSGVGPKGSRGAQGFKGEQGVKGEKGEVVAGGGSGGSGGSGVPGAKGDAGEKGQKGESGTVGGVGTKGQKGDTGNIGATGDQGFKGNKGDIGPQGIKGEIGPQGIQGIQGQGGAIGATGQKGEQGLQGIEGSQGSKGDTGSQGLQGIQGVQGIKGDAGPQGIQGEIGPQGQKGDAGAAGIKGEIGPQGIQGVQGLQGQDGQKGEMGSIGLTGLTGDKGESGQKGDKGDLGPQGVKGNAGDLGETGPQGIQGVQGIEGAKGDKGDVGPAGADGAGGDGIKGDKGEPGTASDGLKGEPGIQGIKGDKGEQGIQGLQGIQGVQGIKGDAGPVGDKGDIGPQGVQGTQGIQGIKGDIGPQGEKGDTGQQGVQGLQGIQGPTGPTGLQGDVGQKGEAGPQGIQGTKGDTGPQGEVGPQGIQGIQGETGTKGEKGETGPQGIQGTKGDTGPQGIQGVQGIQGIQGETGQKGETGPAGADGADGTLGAKGDKGDTGIGEKGEAGQKGEPGSGGGSGGGLDITGVDIDSILMVRSNQDTGEPELAWSPISNAAQTNTNWQVCICPAEKWWVDNIAMEINKSNTQILGNYGFGYSATYNNDDVDGIITAGGDGAPYTLTWPSTMSTVALARSTDYTISNGVFYGAQFKGPTGSTSVDGVGILICQGTSIIGEDNFKNLCVVRYPNTTAIGSMFALVMDWGRPTQQVLATYDNVNEDTIYPVDDWDGMECIVEVFVKGTLLGCKTTYFDTTSEFTGGRYFMGFDLSSFPELAWIAENEYDPYKVGPITPIPQMQAYKMRLGDDFTRYIIEDGGYKYMSVQVDIASTWGTEVNLNNSGYISDSLYTVYTGTTRMFSYVAGSVVANHNLQLQDEFQVISGVPYLVSTIFNDIRYHPMHCVLNLYDDGSVLTSPEYEVSFVYGTTGDCGFYITKTTPGDQYINCVLSVIPHKYSVLYPGEF